MPYAAKEILVGTLVDFVSNGSYFTNDGHTYWVDQMGIDVGGNVLTCQIVSLKGIKNKNDFKELEQYEFCIKTFTKGEYTLDWMRPFNGKRSKTDAAATQNTETITKTAMMSARAAALNSAVNFYSYQNHPISDEAFEPIVKNHSADDVLQLAEKFLNWISQ